MNWLTFGQIPLVFFFFFFFFIYLFFFFFELRPFGNFGILNLSARYLKKYLSLGLEALSADLG